MGLLLHEVGMLMPEATEKVELLNAFFASVLTARGSFRNPRPWWQERKPGEMRNSHCLKWIGLEFIEANLSHTHPWSPKGCAHECWGYWKCYCSPSSLKGHGEHESCLRTGGKPMSLQYSKGARRRTQGTTGQAASPQSQER